MTAAEMAGAEGQDTKTRLVDPRAVRVVLAPSVAHAELPPLVVEPVPVPVAPIPTVVGRGILGGHAAPPVEPRPATGSGHPMEVVVDGETVLATLTSQGPGRATLTVGAGMVQEGSGTRLILEAPETLSDGRGAVRREIVVDGWRIELDVESERRAALRDRARRGREESARGGPTEVHAIIPGRIVSVSVVPGDAVVASQQLLVVEAMKMQNELRAPRDGVISRVAVASGQTIEIGDLLLVLE